MGKLLSTFLALLTSVVTLSAQVGSDPFLVSPDGSPALVHANTPRTNSRVESSRTQEGAIYHIPGTIRGAERNAMGERLPPEEDIEYSRVGLYRDTTSIFVFDSSENARRNATSVPSDPRPTSDDVIELFPSD